MEIWGVGWWENVYNLFNNSGMRCGIIEMREMGGGVEKGGARLTIVMWGETK